MWQSDSSGDLVHPSTDDAEAGASDEQARVVLHIDCDHFFLQVHQRADVRIQRETAYRPCALYQYSDVICMNAAAKDAGVKKHHRPHQARALLEPLGGRLLHAFWRRWPGKRVVATPYQDASREFFQSIEVFLQMKYPSCHFVVEQTSIDECFIDCTEYSFGLIDRGEHLAQTLRQHLLEEKNFRVSIGVSFNRLVAKLASAQAKRDSSAYRIKTVVRATLRDFLHALPATKLPGLGQKKSEIDQMHSDIAAMNASNGAVMSIADLQSFTHAQLRQYLKLKSDAAAQQIWEGCRGRCRSAVTPCPLPRSAGATSWVADCELGQLARKEQTEEGSSPVVVGAGQWVFEPHHGAARHAPGPRWILLALALDLAERLDARFRACREVPSALCVVLTRKDATLSTVRRSARLPADLQALLAQAEAHPAIAVSWGRGHALRDETALTLHGITISEEHSALQPSATAPAAPADAFHLQCASKLVDVAAPLVAALASQHGQHLPVLRASIVASDFVRRHDRSISALFSRADASAAPSTRAGPRDEAAARSLQAPTGDVVPTGDVTDGRQHLLAATAAAGGASSHGRRAAHAAAEGGEQQPADDSAASKRRAEPSIAAFFCKKPRSLPAAQTPRR